MLPPCYCHHISATHSSLPLQSTPSNDTPLTDELGLVRRSAGVVHKRHAAHDGDLQGLGVEGGWGGRAGEQAAGSSYWSTNTLHPSLVSLQARAFKVLKGWLDPLSASTVTCTGEWEEERQAGPGMWDSSWAAGQAGRRQAAVQQAAAAAAGDRQQLGGSSRPCLEGAVGDDDVSVQRHLGASWRLAEAAAGHDVGSILEVLGLACLVHLRGRHSAVGWSQRVGEGQAGSGTSSPPNSEGCKLKSCAPAAP